ncbi:MAG: MarR family transcriptional regulator [Legionella sp.]|uniref:MarR family winged helix-turn-helix transcriptional regulator n=1 Tax=Legionella sp. TaxID=459 RepID=UPI0039E6A4CB
MSTTDKELPKENAIPELLSDKRSKNIIFALRKMIQQMDFHSRRLNKCCGLTVPQIVCLYEIYENDMTTLSALSKKVFLSMSTLVGVIDRLEEKKLVHRTRDDKDRRNIYISITNKGKDFVHTSPYLLHNRLSKNLRLLSEKDQMMLENSVNLLVNLLNDL